MYSKEKAGILRAERLRDALYDVGFQLSSDIMSIIMLKYMRKDGTLRLGDFASAILHLTTAFGMRNVFSKFSFAIIKKVVVNKYFDSSNYRVIESIFYLINYRGVPAQGP